MNMARRRFLQGALLPGAGAATGDFGAVHDAAGEVQLKRFEKFKANVVLLPGKYGGRDDERPATLH